MKQRKGIHILPSLFTTGNVFCGFYAFVAVLNEDFYQAAWAISVGMIFDGLDGRIARLTKTTSAFGMQYDSLADIISTHFIGLPSPAAAVVVASIVIAFEDLFATRINPFIMVMVIYALAFLMVSNIKYPAFKKFNFNKRVAFSRFLFIILFIYVLATIPRVALFLLGVSYTVIGPIGLLIKNKEIVSEESNPSEPKLQ